MDRKKCLLQLDEIQTKLENITNQEKQEEFQFGTIQKQLNKLRDQVEGIIETGIWNCLNNKLEQLHQGNAMSQIFSMQKCFKNVESQFTLLRKDIQNLQNIKLELQTNTIGQRFEIVQHNLLDIKEKINVAQQNLNKEFQKQTQKYDELNKIYLDLKQQYHQKIVQSEEISEINEKPLPKNIIKLKVSCPCTNKDCQKVSRQWNHEVCGKNTYVSNIGYIYCDNCKDDRHWQCKEYFIKYASFNCQNNLVNAQYRQVSQFLMALAQSLQAAEENLNDNDLVLFAAAINTSVIKEWQI